MAINIQFFNEIKQELLPFGARLVAVSKTKPSKDIQALYDAGQRYFGENYVQELLEKHGKLPGDIYWHFIGHLQSNKVKYIAPFVSMIESVDNIRLLREINKQAKKHARVIDVLLQVHLGKEETKFGMELDELDHLLEERGNTPSFFDHTRLCGLMGMASNTDDEKIIRDEFNYLKQIFESLKNKYRLSDFSQISMGMSSDYKIALEAGSTMVRIGSLLFGSR